MYRLGALIVYKKTNLSELLHSKGGRGGDAVEIARFEEG